MNEKWPADKVERRKIDQLIPYSRNSRTHSDAQVAQIAASIKEWGFTNPVLVDEEGQIIAGHGRVMAARKLGMSELPVMVASGWTKAQKRAYVIADNKLALNAGWDDELLALELGELDGVGFDLDLTGFSVDEIDALSKVDFVDGLTDEDDIPEFHSNPVTKTGDIWILGAHRLLCGDSKNIGSIELLVKSEKIDAVFTDPMYDDEVIEFVNVITALNIDHIILMTTFKQAIEVFKASDFVFKFDSILYFKTPSSMMNKKVPYYHHKNVFYMTSTKDVDSCFSCSNAKGVFSDSEYYPSVIEASKNTKEAHGLTKPVDSIVKLLSGYKASSVIDLFAGSGTTIIACEKTSRKCFAVEINEQYCDLIIERWQNFTGKKATLESTGQTFSEVSNEKSNKTAA